MSQEGTSSTYRAKYLAIPTEPPDRPNDSTCIGGLMARQRKREAIPTGTRPTEVQEPAVRVQQLRHNVSSSGGVPRPSKRPAWPCERTQ